MSTTTVRKSKIDLLQALIAHPRTPENERDAAQRMLARIQAKSGNRRRVTDNRWYGEKYDHSLSTTQIAARIRDEIKVARKLAKKPSEPGDIKLIDVIGEAPAGIKISVRSEYYSGGSSIHVTVKNIPDGWGWTRREDECGHEREYPTPALCELGVQLRALMNAYNHDGSDSMTDHFDVNFYGHVNAEYGDQGFARTIA